MKILIVLTSHDRLGNTGRKTGFWLEEFAAPYFVFRDAGVELTLASPNGGQPPIDPKSDLPENQTAAMARFKRDEAAQQALAHTALHEQAGAAFSDADRKIAERAENVKRYLYEHHQVPLHKINVISYGEEKPVAPNKTKAGRAQNRRVVIKVLT